MIDIVAQGQLEILARTLHVPAARLAHLQRLSAAEILQLREAVANVIFDEHAETFKRISMLVPIAPLSLFLPIVQRMVPPMMAGRAAGAVGLAHPKKTGPALAMLKVEYSASAAPYIDPRAVETLVNYAPVDRVVQIAAEIIKRRDFATAGLFVDYATAEIIRAVETGITDDEGLLRAGVYVMRESTLNNIVGVIHDNHPARIARLVNVAVQGPQELQLAALSVWARLKPLLADAVGDAVFDFDDETLTALIEYYFDAGAGHTWGEFAAKQAPKNAKRYGELVARLPQELQHRIIG